MLEDTDVVIISVGNGMNTDDDEKKSDEFVDKKIDTERKLGMFSVCVGVITAVFKVLTEVVVDAKNDVTEAENDRIFGKFV